MDGSSAETASLGVPGQPGRAAGGPPKVLLIDMWPDRLPDGAIRDRFRALPICAQAHGCTLTTLYHSQLAAEPLASRMAAAISGLIISGSITNLIEDPQQDPVDGLPLAHFHATMRLLEVLPETIPVLGICFGHQFLARANGGRLYRLAAGRDDNDFEVQPLAADPLLAGLPERPRFVESHGWTVVDPGPSYQVVARSPDGIEMMRHLRWPRVGVQFHPEYFTRQPPDRAHGRRFLDNWFTQL